MGPIEQEFYDRFKRRINMSGAHICTGGNHRCEDCRCNLPWDWKKKDEAAMKAKEFKLITAEEARAVAIGDWRSALARINDLIKKTSSEGNTVLRVPYDLLKVHGWNASFKNPEVQIELEKAGYIVTTRTADLQFTDVWLEISW
jgi:hypothetical protein